MSNRLLSADAAPATSTGSATPSTKNRRKVLGLAGSVLAALMLVLGGAGVANAASPDTAAPAAATTTPVTITSLTPGPAYTTASKSVVVKGTGTPGEYVAVTECNYTLGGLNGTYCNHTAPTSTAYKYVQVASNGKWQATITVRSSFANWNYQMNQANTGTTDCTASGTQCQVQASQYTTNPPASGPDGYAGTNISFDLD